MSFTAEQVTLLSGDLDARHVKNRDQAGRKLSYVEGWHVIDEANRIFGFDAWSSETVECRSVSERERTIGKPPYQKQGWGVTYVARVRVTVRAGDTTVTREGVGSGHGIDADLGAAHESAIKEAETDARKRALMTFGNKFGLALYDKTQSSVRHGADDDAPEPASPPPAPKQQEPKPAPRPEPTPARAPAPAPQAQPSAARNAPTADSISAKTRAEMLDDLDDVESRDQLAGWERVNSRTSGKWERMSSADRAAVKDAYTRRKQLLAQLNMEAA